MNLGGIFQPIKAPIIFYKMAAEMQLPVNVSPLIKGVRWTLLLVGATYGYLRYNRLMKMEKRRLDELERTRPEREARAAEEKRRKDQAEIEELERLAK